MVRCSSLIKTEGGLQQRARATVRILWFALLLLTIGSLIATISVRPSSLHNYFAHPIIFAVPVSVAACLGGILFFSRARQGTWQHSFVRRGSGLHDGGSCSGIIPGEFCRLSEIQISTLPSAKALSRSAHSSRGTGVVGIRHADGTWLLHTCLQNVSWQSRFEVNRVRSLTNSSLSA